MPQRSSIHGLALVGLAVSLAAAGCSEVSPPGPVGSAAAPIVMGKLETGWDGVGAIVDLTGGLCTGTLIAPSWVLTAAHCLPGTKAYLIAFFTGSDLNKPGGTWREADFYVIHPQYNGSDADHDIALLHLAAPLTGTTVREMNSTALDSSFVGKQVLYVGYGEDNPVAHSGSGVKRSGNVPLSSYDSWTYTSGSSATGVCFGDSGGPGLLQVGGAWKVIGVNSQGGGTSCQSGSSHVRVDAHQSWIKAQLAATLPSCGPKPSLCGCAGACTSAGTCDNNVCRTLSCGQVIACGSACPSTDTVCSGDCLFRGTAAGRAEYDAIVACDNTFCAGKQGTAHDTCMDKSCGAPLASCLTGPMTCEAVETCLEACPTSDALCNARCYYDGTAQAQTQLDGMNTCITNKCAAVQSDPAKWQACVWQSCGTEVETCLPPTNCNIVGGQCAAGQACWPNPSNHMDCYASGGAKLGQPCDPKASGLTCADGAYCQPVTSGGVCAKICKVNTDCPAAQTCQLPLFKGIADVGACVAGSKPPDAGPQPTGDRGIVSTPDAAGSKDAGAGVQDAAVVAPDVPSEAPPVEEPASKGGCSMALPRAPSSSAVSFLALLGGLVVLAAAARCRRSR